MPQDYEVYDLGDARLQRGATLRDCKLAYKTFGNLNNAKDNAVVQLNDLPDELWTKINIEFYKDGADAVFKALVE
jgi:hypothetical protein